MLQDSISVLIKYRTSFAAALLQRVVELPINPRDLLSQASDDNSKAQSSMVRLTVSEFCSEFRYQLGSKPGSVLEIATQNAPAVCNMALVRPT